jgi:hypothetical protein
MRGAIPLLSLRALMAWTGTTSLLPLVEAAMFYVNKGIPQQAEVALGVLGRLRPQIFSTFGTTRVVGCQPNAPAAFTPGEIPGTHFRRLIRHHGTRFCRKKPRKKSQVTPPGIDPGTVQLVAHCYVLCIAVY